MAAPVETTSPVCIMARLNEWTSRVEGSSGVGVRCNVIVRSRIMGHGEWSGAWRVES